MSNSSCTFVYMYNLRDDDVDLLSDVSINEDASEDDSQSQTLPLQTVAVGVQNNWPEEL